LSRAAGIPTGWEITLGLIRRLGALDGVSEHEDWAQWFRDKHGNEPNYSEILDAVATTASERRAILHGYIEAEEGDDARRPTKAHNAIAKLVVDGAVRVIITTNFDRLIENALREAGVEPTVIASADMLAGATPMIHARCTVIKVHGDYLDTRIKNTDAELSGYDPAIDGLLDEVFDRFGLIVVGWSGEWDTALRAALLRAPNRRYPLYWAARGPIAPLANDLIAHRAGRSVPIHDADTFFCRLRDAVEALQEAARPHPQSVAVALAMARRYCRDDRYALEWAEFLAHEVAGIRAFIMGDTYPKERPEIGSFNAVVCSLVAKCEILRRACLLSGRWGTSEANRSVARAIRSIDFGPELGAWYSTWVELRELCASLCFHWAVAGAIARDDFATARSIMYINTGKNGIDQVAATALPLLALGNNIDWKWLNGLENHKLPASELMFRIFTAEAAADAAEDLNGTTDLFNRVELLISLEFAHIRLGRMATDGIHFWCPFGRFLWQGRNGSALARMTTYKTLPSDHPLLRAGLLGGTPESASKAVSALGELLAQMPSLY
jgi:hypothetical protein